jgi:hypothetical protein
LRIKDPAIGDWFWGVYAVSGNAPFVSSTCGLLAIGRSCSPFEPYFLVGGNVL